MKAYPPPRITTRLGNSSKLRASSDVIPNSCKTALTVTDKKEKTGKRRKHQILITHPKILL